ncbi:MAG: glutaminyl-peptide cyclotransferase [Phycisphaerae bacterium]|nr:glutaminyl-peptide cyclotransferase [Phycisphaerae bacterium]
MFKARHYSEVILVKRFSKLFVVGLIALPTVALVVFGLFSKSPDSPAIWTCEIVNTFDHDRAAFTQGLVFEDGVLYEGTGLNGRSELRKVELQTGKVLQSHKLPDRFFGEGITIFEDRIIQLTYLSRVGFVYDKNTFEQLEEFKYPTEGWGLTHDGKHLIMSDGTPMIYFLDPQTFARVRKIMVLDQNTPIGWVNELEYIDGQIYANVWPGDRIARIDPETGQIIGWIDCEGLLTARDKNDEIDVFNGIAHDPATGRLFVTGKCWPKLFEIKLVPAR